MKHTFAGPKGDSGPVGDQGPVGEYVESKHPPIEESRPGLPGDKGQKGDMGTQGMLISMLN